MGDAVMFEVRRFATLSVHLRDRLVIGVALEDDHAVERSRAYDVLWSFVCETAHVTEEFVAMAEDVSLGPAIGPEVDLLDERAIGFYEGEPILPRRTQS